MGSAEDWVRELAEWCGEPGGRSLPCTGLRLAGSMTRPLCVLFWTAAVAAYLPKLLFGGFDERTAYGKSRTENRLSVGIVRRGDMFLMLYLWAIALVHAFLLMRLLAGGADEWGCSFSAAPFPAVTVLFGVHVARRAFESFAVHRFSPAERMEPINVISGLMYYLFAPLTFLDADLGPLRITPAEADVLPLGLGGWATARDPLTVAPPTGAAWLRPVGVGLWAVGMVLQLWHHVLLARLRPDKPTLAAAYVQRCRRGDAAQQPQQQQQQRVYALPSGGLFCIYACPHYVSEVMLYTGMVLVVWSRDARGLPASLPMLMAFVCLNLGANARRQARFYWEKFQARRWVILPYVF
eukprot:TRINITY_DN6607_c1_g1_i1.p1 TRINITY_DN6607_c1_g1~~TRINITY_DN6607_c1_g1_i1.p1  ORF type:complete len:380 (+),score=119.98 TRINITY_DN6607_c1_g1_i1:86-1141(+)